MSFKAIVSGNENYGLASHLKKRWPKSEFWSRSTNNKDLSLHEVQQLFAIKSIEYSIYVSCSSLEKFAQINLLKEVVDTWREHNHAGHILVLGSAADATTKGNSKTYAVEKKALRAYCRQLCFMIQGDSPEKSLPFRISYISVGHLNTPKKRERHGDIPHLECEHVVQSLEWILTQPISINISELSIDPVI